MRWGAHLKSVWRKCVHVERECEPFIILRTVLRVQTKRIHLLAHSLCAGWLAGLFAGFLCLFCSHARSRTKVRMSTSLLVGWLVGALFFFRQWQRDEQGALLTVTTTTAAAASLFVVRNLVLAPFR